MVDDPAVLRLRAARHVSIGDRVLSFRDRLLTSPAFQRWAARFPLTRPIARRQAKAAFDLCAGFVYSQVLHAVIRLGILEAVRSEPLLEGVLLRRVPLPEVRAKVLVDSAIGLGLLARRRGGRIGLGMAGAAIVANPGIAAMIEHHALFYADLADPVALLDGSLGETRLASFWPYARVEDARLLVDDQVAPYSSLMTRSQSMLVGDILDTYPFGRHRSILDVGGGEGEFVVSLARREPAPSLGLFDLPAVARRAQARISAAHLEGRIAVAGGSFWTDELPRGFDVVTLVRVLHDHDDGAVMQLLRSIRRALPAGGTLVIAEPMAAMPDTERVADVYFAFYLMAMGSGRPRSAATIGGLLEAAGFCDVRVIPTARPLLVGLVVASASSIDKV